MGVEGWMVVVSANCLRALLFFVTTDLVVGLVGGRWVLVFSSL